MASSPRPQPTPDDRHNVTELLHIAESDPEAKERLYSILYADLRRMARRAMDRERRDHTLQPTALVHEAFMRLVGRDIPWTNRQHFFALAATAMRRILIDYARSAVPDRRPGAIRVDFNDYLMIGRDRLPNLIALDEILSRLEAKNPLRARIVECKFFLGMSNPEIASTLGIHPKKVQREWRLARAWLHAELGGMPEEPSDPPESANCPPTASV